MKLKDLIRKNKRKISRAFKEHSYWRDKLSTSRGRRHYYHGGRNYRGTGEFVWVY